MTSRFHSADKAPHTMFTSDVSADGDRLQANKILSLNWQRLNQTLPLVQYTSPLSEQFVSPDSCTNVFLLFALSIACADQC